MAASEQLQMSWEPRRHNRNKNKPPLGLKNLGNSCYINSVLQCLTFTPPLANFCLRNQHSVVCDSFIKKGDCVFCILEKRIARSLNVDFVADVPNKILSSLKLFVEHFQQGRQEDAHEFLRYVIDKCHIVCLGIKKLQEEKGGGSGKDGETVVREIFGGVLRNQVRCTVCGARSNKDDEMMDISLDILSSDSVKDAMQKFFQPEFLDGSNKYSCEKCKKLVKARKQMYILQAPNVLVVHLKRFEGVFRGKIDKDIAFQETMVLSSFMSKASQDPCPEYSLSGTIVHAGLTADSGHYYAYIKDTMGKWYCCNDSFVTISSLREVLSEKVYILFFTRTNRKLAPSHTPIVSNDRKHHVPNNSNGATGVSSPHCNGSQQNGVITHNVISSCTSRPESIYPAEPLKANVFHEPSLKNALPTTKVGKGSGSLQTKFSTLTNSLAKKGSLSRNGELHENKTQFVEKNGSFIQSKHEDKNKKNIAGLVNGDDSAINGTHSYQGNGRSLAIGDVDVNKVLHAAEPDVRNVSLKKGCPIQTDALSGPRNSEETKSDNILTDVVHSEDELKKLQKSLVEHASLVLQKCGWSNEVYEHMKSTKRLHEADHALPLNDESKKLLIADAKQNFIRKIPESLKEDLVEQLKTFMQAKLPRKRKADSAYC